MPLVQNYEWKEYSGPIWQGTRIHPHTLAKFILSTGIDKGSGSFRVPRPWSNLHHNKIPSTSWSYFRSAPGTVPRPGTLLSTLNQPDDDSPGGLRSNFNSPIILTVSIATASSLLYLCPTYHSDPQDKESDPEQTLWSLGTALSPVTVHGNSDKNIKKFEQD